MKKTLLTIAALGVLATSGFAQGRVTFSAGTIAATRMSTNTVVGGAGTGLTSNGANTFYYALFASASATTVGASTTSSINGVSSGTYAFNDAAWTFVGFATNTTAVGRLAGAGPNTDSSYSIAGNTGSSRFVTIGWNAAITGGAASVSALSTWYTAGANSGFIGQSTVSGLLALGDGNLVANANPFGNNAGQVPGFVLGLTAAAPVPEPGTMALAALGGASLLLLRRKK
jgi:PEP-CTERM motif